MLMEKESNNFCTRKRKIFGVIIVILIVIAVCVAVIVTSLGDRKQRKSNSEMSSQSDQCGSSKRRDSSLPCCNVTLVESIPENLTYPEGSPTHQSVFRGLLGLLEVAESSIHIASSYWTMRGDDLPVKDPSSWQGEKIFQGLIDAGKRGVKIKIVHQVPFGGQPYNDTVALQEEAFAEVRTLNLERLIGAGILHTKMWLVDSKHFYVGSANMDWRSLTQVKELGFVTSNCSCLSEDMAKIFDVYWNLAEPGSKIPDPWPHSLDTNINKDHPLPMMINNDMAEVYLSSSPPPLCPKGRTTDIDSILDVIQRAQKFVHISVMDYAPAFLYTNPKQYWAVIDDALRKAAFDRGVEVHMMASIWEHTKDVMIPFLKSLNELNNISTVNIEVRLFRVPCYTEAQKKIPFSRVQHCKYMVTDNAAYVGTSNWSGDYFVSTGGIGYIVNQTMTSSPNTLQEQLEAVFSRDWNSNFTKSIWDF